MSVSNINGSIRVDGTDGKTVSVEATRKGGETDSAQYPIEVKQDGDEVTVRMCCGSCAKKLSNCNNPPEVHFVVKVPRDSSLETSSVNAPVKVSGVTGEQEVSVVAGDVSVKGSRGKAAVSGNVKLTPEALADTEVSTVSGNVKLKLPRGAGANVEFSSVGGSFNGKSVNLGSTEQKYGNGEHDVEVSTVGGALDIQAE